MYSGRRRCAAASPEARAANTHDSILVWDEDGPLSVRPLLLAVMASECPYGLSSASSLARFLWALVLE